MRIKYRISGAGQKSFCVAQNEANRPDLRESGHFVSVVKKMWQAWDDDKASRGGWISIRTTRENNASAQDCRIRFHPKCNLLSL